MRLDDSTLAVTLARLKAATFLQVDAGRHGMFLVTSPGHRVHVSDIISALQDLQTRREQDAWVRQQLLPPPQD